MSSPVSPSPTSLTHPEYWHILTLLPPLPTPTCYYLYPHLHPSIPFHCLQVFHPHPHPHPHLHPHPHTHTPPLHVIVYCFCCGAAHLQTNPPHPSPLPYVLVCHHYQLLVNMPQAWYLYSLIIPPPLPWFSVTSLTSTIWLHPHGAWGLGAIDIWADVRGVVVCSGCKRRPAIRSTAHKLPIHMFRQ